MVVIQWPQTLKLRRISGRTMVELYGKTHGQLRDLSNRSKPLNWKDMATKIIIIQTQVVGNLFRTIRSRQLWNAPEYKEKLKEHV